MLAEVVREGERGRRVGLDVDGGEARARQVGDRLGGQRAGVRRRRSRRASRRRARAGRGSRRRPCRRGSTRRRRSRAAPGAARAASRRPRACARRRGSRRRGSRGGPGRLASASGRCSPRNASTASSARRSSRRPRRGARTPRLGGRRCCPAPRPRASRRRSPRACDPSTSVCSRPTFVSSTTRASIVFVASWRPPSPASIAATVAPRAAKSANAAAVTASNWVAPTASASGADPLDRAFESVGVGVEPLVPAGRRAATCTRARRSCARCGARRSICPSCRRRGRASNGRCGIAEARRAAHASAPSRTRRPARATSDSSHEVPGTSLNFAARRRAQPPIASSSRR